MAQFDLRTVPRSNSTVTPPAGYQAGRVIIDDLDETIFFSTEYWSAEHYAEHWRDAARRVVDGDDFAAFCTDLNRDNCCLFVGFRSSNGVAFEEWVVPRPAVKVDGLHIALITTPARHHDGEVSSWLVPMEAVRTFADS